MHVPPQLWVVAFALATALVARLARATTAPRAGGAACARAHRAWNERMPAVVHAETLVLLAADARDGAWRAAVWGVLSSARTPVRVGVLIACDAGDDDVELDDPVLRRHVRVATCKTSASRHPAEVARRLVRKFVDEAEDVALVVLVHARARPLDGWDVRLREAARDAPEDAVLTCPTAAADGATARFPCLRKRSNGSAARGASRAFAPVVDGATVVPATCWCAELACATPATARRVWASGKAGHAEPSLPAAPHTALPAGQSDAGQSVTRAFVAHRASARAYVPTAPLLAHDDALEDDVLDDDDGCAVHPLHRRELVGLTRRASTSERIVKFGSTAASRAAMREA